MTCYSPSRYCLSSGLVALGLAAFTSWVGLQHPTAWIATVLFGIPAIILLVLAFQPPIEVYEHHLVLGRRIIPWAEIRRLDRTSWMTPLDRQPHAHGRPACSAGLPGRYRCGQEPASSPSALRQGCPDRRNPVSSILGEVLPGGSDRRQLPSPRYQLLRPEDEAEVERLFQRLKTVGHLDPKNSEEK